MSDTENDTNVTDTEMEMNSESMSELLEVKYDLNILEEYMSLFGNPYNQTVKTVLTNVRSLMWPNEEIENLFIEMMDETYENIMNETQPGYDILMENFKVFNK